MDYSRGEAASERLLILKKEVTGGSRPETRRRRGTQGKGHSRTVLDLKKTTKGLLSPRAELGILTKGQYFESAGLNRGKSCGQVYSYTRKRTRLADFIRNSLTA